MNKSNLGELRALVAQLEQLPDETPLTILFDSDYAEAHGIELVADASTDPGVLLSISRFQH